MFRAGNVNAAVDDGMCDVKPLRTELSGEGLSQDATGGFPGRDDGPQLGASDGCGGARDDQGRRMGRTGHRFEKPRHDALRKGEEATTGTHHVVSSRLRASRGELGLVGMTYTLPSKLTSKSLRVSSRNGLRLGRKLGRTL